MEDLLKKIIDIEKDAQQIVKQARIDREHFDCDLARQSAAIEQQIAEETEQAISAQQESQRIATEAQNTQIRQQVSQKRQKMDAAFSQNFQAWSEHIFAKVLGR